VIQVSQQRVIVGLKELFHRHGLRKQLQLIDCD
jgi:hypothetical protein